MKSRLQKILDVLGWQGGNVHQVQDELTKMGLKGWDVLEDSPASFEHLLTLVDHKVKQQKRMSELGIHICVPWRGRGGNIGDCIYCGKKA